MILLMLFLALPGARADSILTISECNVAGEPFVSCYGYVPLGGVNGVPPLTLWFGATTTPDCGKLDLGSVYEASVLDGPGCSVTVLLLVANETVSVPRPIDDANLSSDQALRAGSVSISVHGESHPLAAATQARESVVDLLAPFGDAAGPAVRGDLVPLLLAAENAPSWSPNLGSIAYGDDGLIRMTSDVALDETPPCYGFSTTTEGLHRDAFVCPDSLP